MKFSDYLIGNQWGQPMYSQVQTPIQPQQMQSIAPQQSMQSSVTDFWIKPNQSAPKKKVETFDVLWMLEKTNQFTQQAIKDNPVSKWNTVYTWRNKNIREIQEWIEQSTKETHKLNTLLDMKRYIDDWATLEEFQADFWDVPQEILPQIYEEFAYWTKMKDILKLYPELDNIQPPQKLREKYDIKKFFNPLWEAGKTILKAKEKAKEDWSFLTSNPLTQWFMGTVWWAVKWVWDLGAWIVWLSDTINAWAKSVTQWWTIDQYKERPTTTSEDALNIFWWGTTTVWSVFALPAITLINAGIETLPQDRQVALSDSMDWLWDKIAQTPWLKQWMQSLPPDRQSEFKQELANAWVWLLLWLKNKKNIVTDPKTFLKENINPIAIAKNFNENVLWIPSNAWKAIKWVSETLWNTELWIKAKKVSGKIKNAATRDFPISRIEKDLWLTPTERGKVENTGITAWQFVLEKWLWWSPKEVQINKLQEIADNSYNGITAKVKEIKTLTKSDDAVKMLETMIDEMESSKILKREKSDYINKLKELSSKKEYTPSELLAIRRDFDKIVWYQLFDSKWRVSWAEDTVISNWRSWLSDQIQKIWEENWIDIKDMNTDLRNSVVIRDWLLRRLSQENKNNTFWLQDIGVGAILSAGEPITATAIIIWKKALEKAIPSISQKLYNTNKSKYVPTNMKRGVSITPRDKSNGFSIATDTNDSMTTAWIENPQAALPYKWELWETTNTIIAPWKDIVTSPQGNFIKWQILDTNNSKNATANTSNIDDNSITTVKKKPVQSDTLASKADEIESDRLANAQYIKEDTISNIQSIAKKNPEIIRKLLQKDWLPDNKIQSFIDDASNGKISERQAKNIRDALGKSEVEEEGNLLTNSNDISKSLISKELQPLYEEARKYKSAEEFAKWLKNEDDMKAKILMDWFNEKYKNRSFEDMLPKWIEYTPDQLSFFKSRVEPNMQLSLQDAKSLMNNDKNILDKINKKMWIDMTRNKERWEIFDSQLRKIREEANKELQPLYDEAKKYKSADEFVKKNSPNYNIEKVWYDLENKYWVKLDIYPKSNYMISLDKIEVPKTSRNKWVWTKVMDEIIDFADKNWIDISLTPDTSLWSSKWRLIDFYKKFWFVENKWSKQDFLTRNTYIRRSKNNIINEKNIEELRKIREEANRK